MGKVLTKEQSEVSAAGGQTPVGATSWLRHHITDVMPAVIIVVLCVTFACISGKFGSLVNIETIIDNAAVPLVISVGATGVVVMGSVDLSVEGVMAAAGVVFVLLAKNSANHNDFGVWAVLAGLAVGLIIGAFNGILHVFARLPSFMVSLGSWYIALGVATVLTGSAADPELQSQSLLKFNVHHIAGLPPLTWLAVVVVVVGALLHRFTRFGRYTFAIGADQKVASMAGVNVDRQKVITFMIAGLCSALAGIMLVIQIGQAGATVTSGYLFETISGVVVGGTLLSGGRGGIGHSAMGILILAILADGLVLVGVNSYWQQATQGVIIVVAVIASGIPSRARLNVVK